MKLKKKHYFLVGILLIFIGTGILGKGFGLYAIGVKNVGYWTLSSTLYSEVEITSVSADTIYLKDTLTIREMFLDYGRDTNVIGKIYTNMPEDFFMGASGMPNYNQEHITKDKLYDTFTFNSHSDWVCEWDWEHPLATQPGTEISVGYGYNCILSFNINVPTGGANNMSILIGFEIPEWNYDKPIDTVPHYVQVNISTAMSGEVDEETGEQEGVDTEVSMSSFIGEQTLDTSETTIGEPEMSPMMIALGSICFIVGAVMLMKGKR